MSEQEFVDRFVARLLALAGRVDSEGEPVEPYARETAASYFEDQYRDDGMSPEECAASDYSYWEPA